MIPSRNARCMAQTRSGSAPESSRKLQLLTTTRSEPSCQTTSGSRPCSSATCATRALAASAVARRLSVAGKHAAPLRDAGLAAHTQSVLARPAGRERVERETREQLVAARREPEGHDLVAQPVQLRRPAATGRAPEAGGKEPRLLELGEVHAGDVGMQAEFAGDVGDGDVCPRPLGDPAVDVVAGIVGKDGRQLVIAVHAPSPRQESWTLDTIVGPFSCKHGARSANALSAR